MADGARPGKRRLFGSESSDVPPSMARGGRKSLSAAGYLWIIANPLGSTPPASFADDENDAEAPPPLC